VLRALSCEPASEQWGETALALEAFYIFASAYLSVFHSQVAAASQPPVPERIGGVFILWFIDIQTYGLAPLVLSLPFSFAYGCVAAAAILWFTRKQRIRSGGRDSVP